MQVRNKLTNLTKLTVQLLGPLCFEHTACYEAYFNEFMVKTKYRAYPKRLTVPGFKGECSVIGHSLGSLILFDLLSGQSEDLPEKTSQPEKEPGDITGEDTDVKIPRWEKDLSIEDVFSKLEITDHLTTFTDQGIGIAELETCSEDDLKEAGLPLGPRKRLLSYLNKKAKRRSGFDEFQASSVARQVSYNVGSIKQNKNQLNFF